MLIEGVTLIDKLAGFIEEGLGIDGRGREISMEEYRTVADECKRLLRQPNFDITTDIERRAREHPTTPSASSWIELKSYWEKP